MLILFASISYYARSCGFEVIYDDDGDWLCFHAYTIKEDDAYIVSIEQIIEHDKTLLSLPDLREGEKVRRSNINKLWEKY